MSIMDDFIFTVISTILHTTQKAYDSCVKRELLRLHISSSQWDDLVIFYPAHYVDENFNIYDFDGEPMLGLCTNELDKLENAIRKEMIERKAILVLGYWYQVEIDDSVKEPEVVVKL